MVLILPAGVVSVDAGKTAWFTFGAERDGYPSTLFTTDVLSADAGTPTRISF